MSFIRDGHGRVGWGTTVVYRKRAKNLGERRSKIVLFHPCTVLRMFAACGDWSEQVCVYMCARARLKLYRRIPVGIMFKVSVVVFIRPMSIRRNDDGKKRDVVRDR